MGGVYYHFYRWNLKGSVKGDLSEESLDHLNCRLDKEVCQITSEDFSKKELHEKFYGYGIIWEIVFWYGLVIYKRGICEWNYSNDKTKLCMAISIEFGLSLNNVCNVICDDDKNSQFFVKYCRFEFKNVIALYRDK